MWLGPGRKSENNRESGEGNPSLAAGTRPEEGVQWPLGEESTELELLALLGHMGYEEEMQGAGVREEVLQRWRTGREDARGWGGQTGVREGEHTGVAGGGQNTLSSC